MISSLFTYTSLLNQSKVETVFPEKNQLVVH